MKNRQFMMGKQIIMNNLSCLVEQVLIVWRNEEVKFELDLEVLVGHVTL